jgi:hypothetical protein
VHNARQEGLSLLKASLSACREGGDRVLNRVSGRRGKRRANSARHALPPVSRPVRLVGVRLSRRLLIRVCRLGQVACLLMSLSGVLVILGDGSPVQAQGACFDVCTAGDAGACNACEQIEHHAGNAAAGSTLVIGGLIGSVALGDLCRGLEQGGGAAGDGGGGRREEGVPLGNAASMATFLAGLGITNADGTPIKPESLSSALDEYWRMGVPPGGSQEMAGTGETRAGPATAEARNRWELLGADAEGRVYDANRQHILNVDADGNVTDLTGKPVRQVFRADDGTGVIGSYVDADGNVIRSSYGGGLQRVETDAEGRTRYHPTDLPEPKGPTLDPDVGAKWQAVGAGINGELYAPDGRILGRIDADGNMFTTDGRPITGSSFAEDGRLRWFNTDDGQHWQWSEDGAFRSSQLPDGEPFRPLSRSEWDRIDQQRAPTQVDSGPSGDKPVAPGTLVDGEEGGRHIGDDLKQRLQAPTGAKGTQVEPGAGETRVPAGADTRVEGGGQKPPPGAAPQRPGGTQVDDGGGGGGAAPGVRTQVEGGEARATGAPVEAEGGRAPAAAGAGEAQPARAGGGDAEPARAGAPDSQTPRAAGTPEAEAGVRSAASTGLNVAMDAENVRQLYNQHVADGKSPAEAFALAVAQTAGGDIASMSGRANAMGASALLPGGLSNLVPEKAVENYLGTGYDALTAVSQSAGASAASGQLDTTALDAFAERVANRPNADPFAGWAQAAQLVGEETARNDGGNLISDLALISETGAGSEVLNESMSSFQQQVEQGAFGSPLQGINYLTQAAAEVVADPSITIGQFVEDVKNIASYGVGDGFWSEAVNSTADVIKNTPVANVIYDGYHQVFQGMADQGVVDFAVEMAEGYQALKDEATQAAQDAVVNAGRSAYDYVRSFF